MEERRILQQEILDIIKEIQEQTNGGFDRRLTILETKFEEAMTHLRADLHVQSRVLGSLDERLDVLPCHSHKERFRVYDDHIEDGKFWRRFMVGQAIVIITALLSAVLFGGYFIGKLEQKINSHIERATWTQLKNTN